MGSTSPEWKLPPRPVRSRTLWQKKSRYLNTKRAPKSQSTPSVSQSRRRRSLSMARAQPYPTRVPAARRRPKVGLAHR